MVRGCSFILVFISLVLLFEGNVLLAETALEYPVYLVDAYDADNSCWTGMDADGRYEGPIRVVPEQWLVGPPLSEKSGVTLPPDHWVEVQFRGPIVDGPGDDILLIELGPVREEALVFVTDGAGREYLLGKATSGSAGGGVDPTLIGFDISGIVWPFEPVALRILGLDTGGEAPGFDIANIRARISNDCGETACNPVPVDGAVNVTIDSILQWSPGNSAQRHAVYLGRDITDVDANANPLQLQDANSFDPFDLQLGTKYYWRIDEVNDSNIRPGEIWSFTTADHAILDDFEQYNFFDQSDPNSNMIHNTWTNAGVYLETYYTHACSKKSMAMSYWFYRDIDYSKTIRTFGAAQNWAAAGISAIELFFYGQSYNDLAQMFMVLGDGSGEIVIPYQGNANDLKVETWQPWRIDLRDIPAINLGNITSISIGFYSEASRPNSNGSGTIFFDDIRLYSILCLAENKLAADLNGDCLVNYKDLEEMTFNWLENGRNTYPMTAPNSPIAWYRFDGDTRDSAGNAHGQPHGNPTYTEGIYGRAIRFDGRQDSVQLTGAADLFSKTTRGITIAFWQYGDESPHHTDTICCSNYIYGLENPVISINLGNWRRPGRYNWDCGRPWSYNDRLSGSHRYDSEWSGRWNHWAFTKDVKSGEMQIFLNGRLYDSRTGAKLPITGINSFKIGSGWYGGYDGLIDDFRIYDYALTGPEIVHAATYGTGIFDLLLLLPADLNQDNRIDFQDFALLANNWLEVRLSP